MHFPLWLSFPFGATRDWTRYCQALSSHLILGFSADPLLFLGFQSPWSRPGSGSARQPPPPCCQVLLVRSLLLRAGAQAEAGRFVVVCGARPFPRCHCSGKAIIPPRDKQGCLWLSPLSPQRLEPLTTGQPGSAPGSRHLPLHSPLHPGIWMG